MHNLAALTLLASGIVLASDGSLELRGTVTGTQDISDLHVQLFGVELPVTATGSVSTRGQFRFRDLEPGNYTVAVVRTGLGEVRRTVVVTPGLADDHGIVRTEIPYSASEAAHMETETISAVALSVSDDARQHYESGQQRRARGDLAGAVSQFQEAVELAPQFAAAWNALGVLAFQSGDLETAEAHYRQAVEADANAFEPMVNLGGLLMRQGRGTEALIYNRRAAAERPYDALALVQLGMNLFQLQRYREAEAPLTAAKGIDPAHHMQPQLFLAEIYRQAGDHARAIAELEELLALRPDSPLRATLTATMETLRKRAD